MKQNVTAATLGQQTCAGFREKKAARSSMPNMLPTRRAALAKLLFVFLLFPTLAFGYPFYLSWNDTNSDDDGTIVYRYVAGEYQEVAILDPKVTDFTDDPPGIVGDSFCWTVRAFREGLISEPSNEACPTVPTTTESSPTNPGRRRGRYK